MQKFIVTLSLSLTIIFLLAWCGFIKSNQIKTESQSALEKEVRPVVESYLEYATAGNWLEVYGTLAGEALTSAKANTGQAKAAGEKIISKKYKVYQTGIGLAKVDADITKSRTEGFDRLAYSFDLIKSGDRWLIYKTTWADYLHDELKPGQLPADVAGIVQTYLEMPFADKRAMDNKYLAGRLLQESEKSKVMPVNQKTYGVLQGTITTVRSLECLGLSDDYAVVKANCSITRDGSEKQASFLIDAVLVNGNGGTWKIADIENL